MAKQGQFKPGNQLGGPKGTNKRFITQRLIAMMHEEVTILEKEAADATGKKKSAAISRKVARLQLFCEKLFEIALAGDMQALKYIADRIEGTPIQTTVMIEETDPAMVAAEQKRAEETRANIANMTDAERTNLYFQTLRQADGISGPSKSH